MILVTDRVYDYTSVKCTPYLVATMEKAEFYSQHDLSDECIITAYLEGLC